MGKLRLIKPQLATLKPLLSAAPHHTTPRLRGRAGVKQRQRRLMRTDHLCEMCKDHGLTVVATVVDHIVPLALGGTDDDSNTRNLCDEHHRIVTAEQFGREAKPTPERYRRR